ncbi:MAG: hypothetical protein HY869_09875, partial [Chloroflexi bacterium]|nr:hypothetical protein [Chloroflexota bacterium]
MGAETILFFGAHFEIKNPGPTQIETKYYLAGGSRVAMRSYTIPYNNMTLTYLMGDHPSAWLRAGLGSTSLAVNASTGTVIETRYKAWGEVRYTTPNVTLPTRNTLRQAQGNAFTGQYSDSYINLLWYGSRHYDPELGRFIQPDSIVPVVSQGVQAFDRYGYTNN